MRKGDLAGDLPAQVAAWLEALAPAWPIPGLAVAVVSGDARHAFGLGVRRAGRAERADADTPFPIGSNTKLMTAAALGLLVDDGRLGWEDRAAVRLPGFRMADPVATAEMTVADLLCHRSGLATGAGDLLLYPQTDFTRAEIVRALAALPPARSFRSGYGYSNLLYVAAAQLLEAAGGVTWEETLRTRLFVPLGMGSATPGGPATGQGEAAWPHAREAARAGARAAPLSRLPDTANAGPAGGVYASARDMAAWLWTLVHDGASPDGAGRLLSPETAAALRRPRTLMPVETTPFLPACAQPQLQAYALGLQVQALEGGPVLGHGGAVFGAVSQLLFAPRDGVGVCLMANMDGRPPIRALAHRLLDHLRGRAAAEWPAAWARLAAAGPTTAPAAARSPPALAPVLDGYAGDYRDSWFGSAAVTAAADGLRLELHRSRGMTGPLSPLGPDRFSIAWESELAEPAVASFRREGGEIVGLRMAAASPTADFSFDYPDLDFHKVAPAAPAPEGR